MGELTLTEEEFELFCDEVTKNSGLHLDQRKKDSLKVSLLSRLRQGNFKSYQDYYWFLKYDSSGRREFKELLESILINETSFFRDPAQFEALEKSVLPETIRRKQETDRSISIWSAGCSTGEEPYSIAMILLETLELPQIWQIQILATDISQQALAVARQGVYEQQAIHFTDGKYLEKYFKCRAGKCEYFECRDEKHQLKNRVKEMVKFSYHNLMDEPYPLSPAGLWDIIFCRNVCIYFQPEVAQKVVQNLYQSLNEGGYLFVGHAESLYHLSHQFVPLEMEKAFVYYKPRQKEMARR